MSSLNRVQIIGNLGQDPVIRNTQNSKVANLSVGTTEKYKKDNEWQETTEWHRVSIWGKLADVCEKYLSKGSKVYIEGSLSTRKYTDKDNIERYSTDIKGYKMLMLDSKGESKPQSNVPDNFDDSEDLPF